MTELLQIRACLNYGSWRTLSIFCEYVDLDPKKEIDLNWNVQISTDKVVLPNDLAR